MKTFSKIAAFGLFAALNSSPALAVDEHFVSDKAVVGGYDVVAYHTVGAPTLGSAKFSVDYQGATWHFASADNMKKFQSDPARYAPAYGGWCAAGASKGKKVPTKPELFAVVDGQLYLNSSPAAHNKLFLADTQTVIRKGERNWKTIFATSKAALLAK